MSCHALFQSGIHPFALRKFPTEPRTEKPRKKQRFVADGMPGATLFALTRAACLAARRGFPLPAHSRSARRPLPGRPHPPLHPSLAFIHDRSLRYVI